MISTEVDFNISFKIQSVTGLLFDLIDKRLISTSSLVMSALRAKNDSFWSSNVKRAVWLVSKQIGGRDISF